MELVALSLVKKGHHITPVLQELQNSATRMVALVKKRHHITPVLQELHWLPVRKQIIYKILLLTKHCAHGLAPHYIRELLLEYQNATIVFTRPGKNVEFGKLLPRKFWCLEGKSAIPNKEIQKKNEGKLGLFSGKFGFASWEINIFSSPGVYLGHPAHNVCCPK